MVQNQWVAVFIVRTELIFFLHQMRFTLKSLTVSYKVAKGANVELKTAHSITANTLEFVSHKALVSCASTSKEFYGFR